MSEPQVSEANPADASREEMLSVLFAQLVMQQANMASMLLGKVPHPETGQLTKDLGAAKLFIDQLEMLEAKTKGNLAKEESRLLQQSLMSLRLAFVEAVEDQSPPAPPQPPAAQAAPPSEGAPAQAPAEDEHRKKFSKKY